MKTQSQVTEAREARNPIDEFVSTGRPLLRGSHGSGGFCSSLKVAFLNLPPQQESESNLHSWASVSLAPASGVFAHWDASAMHTAVVVQDTSEASGGALTCTANRGKDLLEGDAVCRYLSTESVRIGQARKTISTISCLRHSDSKRALSK